MSAGNVKIQFFANSQDAEATIVRLEQKLIKLEGRVSELAKRGKKSDTTLFDQMAEGAIKLGQNLTGVSGPLSAIDKLISTINVNWQDMIDRQNELRGQIPSFASALERAQLTVGGDPDFDPINKPGALTEMALKLADETKVKPDVIMGALASAMSNRGRATAMDAVNAVRAAAKVMPNNPLDLEEISGAGLLLQRVNALSADEAMGYMIKSAEQSPAKSMEKFARNTVPTVTSMSEELGGDVRSPTALLNAVSSAMNDREGRRSATGGLSFQRQLFAAFPEYGEKSDLHGLLTWLNSPAGAEAAQAVMSGGKYKGKRLKRVDVQEWVGPNGEAVAFSDEGKMSLETRSRPAFEQLIMGGTAWKDYQKFYKDLPKDQKAYSRFHAAQIRAAELDPTLNMARQERAAEQEKQSKAIKSEETIEGSLRNRIDEALKNAGYNQLQRWQETTGFDLDVASGISPEDSADAIIRRALTYRKASSRDLPENADLPYMVPDLTSARTYSPSGASVDRRVEEIQGLEKVLLELRRQRKNQEELIRLQKRQAEKRPPVNRNGQGE